MLRSSEVQRDLTSLPGGHDPACEHTGALVPGIALEGQYAHAGVIVVQRLSLRRLPDQLVTRWFNQMPGPCDDLPLRGRWQRNTQPLLQLLQPVERRADAVLELSDHGGSWSGRGLARCSEGRA